MTETRNRDTFFCLSFSAREGHPAELREKARLNEESLKIIINEWLSEFRERDHEASLFYLSTCHRIEFYGYKIPLQALKDNWKSLGLKDVEKAKYYSSEQALEHLIRVASSLESEVLGETQITGQIKETFKEAVSQDWLRGSTLKLFQQALAVAKRIRTECFAHLGTVSIAHVAVDGSDDFFENYTHKKALVVGAGPMAKQAIERLRHKGVAHISWMNRSSDRIQSEAKEKGLHAIPFRELHRRAWEHDITILATRASHTILDENRLINESSPNSINGPKLILDLGLPRNASPKVQDCPSFYLRNVDAFNNLAQFNEKKRKDYTILAEKILVVEKQKILRSLDREKSRSLISELMELIEDRKRDEVERFRLEKNTEIEYITTKVYSGLLHGILKELERLDDQSSKRILDTLIAAWRRSNRWQKRPTVEQGQKNLDP
jgi:glutamyl-tRNA reductase